MVVRLRSLTPLLVLVLSACSIGLEYDPIQMERPSNADGTNLPQPGVITAAEWNDADNWDFWLDLHANHAELAQAIEDWELDAIHRHPSTVVDPAGTPIINARVRLINDVEETLWETRTNNQGQVDLWWSLMQTQGKATQVRVLYGTEEKSWDINTLPEQLALESRALDPDLVQVMFVIDATGSMGDELEYLKVELEDVIDRVDDAHTLETAALLYRDVDDDFLTTGSDFTSETAQTRQFINAHTAAGGNDYPEAVDKALQVAVEGMSWRYDARTRLMFLLLDAPPHNNAQAIDILHDSVKRAAAQGITLIPIAASGTDQNTEFLLRMMALATSGTFVFITDDSGVGNEHLEPTVGEFQVEYLNDLLVRLIQKYSN